jgi:hypothetical protein
MPKFIYSIKEIFDTETGCLKHNNVDGYFIGPYQRGYKWKSQSANDHIPVLLVDLYEAFLKSQENGFRDHEYYLQYITVKRIFHEGKNLFEVIDGQQRLTSLTIMYIVLEELSKKNHSKKGDNYLVSYSRYEGNANIFDLIKSSINLDDNEDEEIEEQDKYYMLKAARCFKMFFGLFDNNRDELDKFCIFINDNVKLILNKEDETTSSEEIFSNLNANKVPLTNSYLIKGLLLTKSSRNDTSGITTKHFREILDERAIMGRTWDEMNSWFSRDDVKRFFFGKDPKGKEVDGMEKMLQLVRFEENKNKSKLVESFKSKLNQGKKQLSNPYELFNHFHENLITSEQASACLDSVKHIFKRLRSWYDDNLSYNLLGYYFASNKSNYSQLKVLIQAPTNKEVISTLKRYLCKQLTMEGIKLKDLKYNNNPVEITKILLAMSVFPKSEWNNVKSTYRFNFFQFDEEDWTLEHIFPQKPKLEKFDIGDDKDWVVSKLKAIIKKETDPERVLKHKETISLIESNQEIETESISFIFEEIKDVNDLGNMALLTGGVNSALSNGFFNTKRKILVKKINSGFFVPKHTIDVFSKMIQTYKSVEFNKSLVLWNENDITAHKNSIVEIINEIVVQHEEKQILQEVNQ